MGTYEAMGITFAERADSTAAKLARVAFTIWSNRKTGTEPFFPQENGAQSRFSRLSRFPPSVSEK